VSSGQTRSARERGVDGFFERQRCPLDAPAVVSRNRVKPSMSMNTKVTVPEGRLRIAQ